MASRSLMASKSLRKCPFLFHLFNAFNKSVATFNQKNCPERCKKIKKNKKSDPVVFNNYGNNNIQRGYTN
jgi:hypothetical protein